MKIAYFLPSTGLSGGITVVCQHANRLIQRGHEVLLITENSGRKIDWFPNQRAPVIGKSEFPGDVDILVATGWSTAFEIVNMPARRKCYFVQSDETRFHPEGSDWQKLAALSYLLNFHYLTEARWIQTWLSQNFHQSAELVPNGLDETLFYLDPDKKGGKKKPRVLLEGAIGLPYKGMADAFAAVSDLDVEVWCISTYGNPEPGWKCDRFFKQVPITEMQKIYSSCDVLLKMSKVEGLFGPPMEMMACGGAVVVSKVTGYDEYIVDGYNALVVEPGDIKAARDAVSRVVSDESLRQQLVYNGLETAKKWNWEPFIDMLESYYLQILSGQGKYESSSRQYADQGIADFYYKTRSSKPFAQSEEPIEIFFNKLRNSSAIKSVIALIYRIYRFFKQSAQRIKLYFQLGKLDRSE